MAEIDRPQAERSPLLPNPSRTPAENPELVYTNKKEREFLERRQAAQQKLDDDIRRAENLAYGEKDANGNIVRLGGTAAQIQEWQRQLDEMSGFGLVSSWSSIIGTKKALRGQIEAEKRLLAEQTKRIEEMKQERAELAKKFEQFDNLAKEAAKKTDTSKTHVVQEMRRSLECIEQGVKEHPPIIVTEDYQKSLMQFQENLAGCIKSADKWKMGIYATATIAFCAIGGAVVLPLITGSLAITGTITVGSLGLGAFGTAMASAAIAGIGVTAVAAVFHAGVALGDARTCIPGIGFEIGYGNKSWGQAIKDGAHNMWSDTKAIFVTTFSTALPAGHVARFVGWAGKGLGWGGKAIGLMTSRLTASAESVLSGSWNSLWATVNRDTYWEQAKQEMAAGEPAAFAAFLELKQTNPEEYARRETAMKNEYFQLIGSSNRQLATNLLIDAGTSFITGGKGHSDALRLAATKSIAGKLLRIGASGSTTVVITSGAEVAKTTVNLGYERALDMDVLTTVISDSTMNGIIGHAIGTTTGHALNKSTNPAFQLTSTKALYSDTGHGNAQRLAGAADLGRKVAAPVVESVSPPIQTGKAVADSVIHPAAHDPKLRGAVASDLAADALSGVKAPIRALQPLQRALQGDMAEIRTQATIFGDTEKTLFGVARINADGTTTLVSSEFAASKPQRKGWLGSLIGRGKDQTVEGLLNNRHFGRDDTNLAIVEVSKSALAKKLTADGVAFTDDGAKIKIDGKPDKLPGIRVPELEVHSIPARSLTRAMGNGVAEWMTLSRLAPLHDFFSYKTANKPVFLVEQPDGTYHAHKGQYALTELAPGTRVKQTTVGSLNNRYAEAGQNAPLLSSQSDGGVEVPKSIVTDGPQFRDFVVPEYSAGRVRRLGKAARREAGEVHYALVSVEGQSAGGEPQRVRLVSGEIPTARYFGQSVVEGIPIIGKLKPINRVLSAVLPEAYPTEISTTVRSRDGDIRVARLTRQDLDRLQQSDPRVSLARKEAGTGAVITVKGVKPGETLPEMTLAADNVKAHEGFLPRPLANAWRAISNGVSLPNAPLVMARTPDGKIVYAADVKDLQGIPDGARVVQVRAAELEAAVRKQGYVYTKPAAGKTVKLADEAARAIFPTNGPERVPVIGELSDYQAPVAKAKRSEVQTPTENFIDQADVTRLQQVIDHNETALSRTYKSNVLAAARSRLASAGDLTPGTLDDHAPPFLREAEGYFAQRDKLAGKIKGIEAKIEDGEQPKEAAELRTLRQRADAAAVLGQQALVRHFADPKNHQPMESWQKPLVVAQRRDGTLVVAGAEEHLRGVEEGATVFTVRRSELEAAYRAQGAEFKEPSAGQTADVPRGVLVPAGETREFKPKKVEAHQQSVAQLKSPDKKFTEQATVDSLAQVIAENNNARRTFQKAHPELYRQAEAFRRQAEAEYRPGRLVNKEDVQIPQMLREADRLFAQRDRVSRDIEQKLKEPDSQAEVANLELKRQALHTLGQQMLFDHFADPKNHKPIETWQEPLVVVKKRNGTMLVAGSQKDIYGVPDGAELYTVKRSELKAAYEAERLTFSEPEGRPVELALTTLDVGEQGVFEIPAPRRNPKAAVPGLKTPNANFVNNADIHRVQSVVAHNEQAAARHAGEHPAEHARAVSLADGTANAFRPGALTDDAPSLLKDADTLLRQRDELNDQLARAEKRRKPSRDQIDELRQRRDAAAALGRQMLVDHFLDPNNHRPIETWQHPLVVAEKPDGTRVVAMSEEDLRGVPDGSTVRRVKRSDLEAAYRKAGLAFNEPGKGSMEKLPDGAIIAFATPDGVPTVGDAAVFKLPDPQPRKDSATGFAAPDANFLYNAEPTRLQQVIDANDEAHAAFARDHSDLDAQAKTALGWIDTDPDGVAANPEKKPLLNQANGYVRQRNKLAAVVGELRKQQDPPEAEIALLEIKRAAAAKLAEQSLYEYCVDKVKPEGFVRAAPPAAQSGAETAAQAQPTPAQQAGPQAPAAPSQTADSGINPIRPGSGSAAANGPIPEGLSQAKLPPRPGTSQA